jgi:hypothetical protein
VNRIGGWIDPAVLETPRIRPRVAGLASRGFLLLFCLGGWSIAASADATGTVCIAAVPAATTGIKSLGNATASATPFDFTVSIGDSAAVDVSHTTSVAMRDLSTTERHRVVIRQAGTPSASFFFRFADHGNTDLCLWFNALYESWSLWRLDEAKGKCDCGGLGRPH